MPKPGSEGHGESGRLSDRLCRKAPRRYLTFTLIFLLFPGNLLDLGPPLLVEQASSGLDLEQKLLAFEQELDSTMATLRKNLMIIRLLGLMSEDDQLQESLMKNSEQLLDFILLTLKRGAAAVESRKTRVSFKQSVHLFPLRLKSWVSFGVLPSVRHRGS